MNLEETINRICAGYIWTQIDGKPFRLGNPSVADKYAGSLIYQEWYSRGIRLGLPLEEEIIDLLYQEEIWDESLERKLEVLKEDIEKLKIGLYEMMLQSNEVAQIRKALLRGKFQLNNLEHRKTCFDHLSCEFMGRMARNNYFALCNIRDAEDNLIVNPDIAFNSGYEHFHKIFDIRTANFLEEFQFRVLARCDYWQSIWYGADKAESLFGLVAHNYSFDQQNLVRWTRLYDSVREHPESPPAQVFDDDDMFDGWMLIQHKNRTQQKQESLLESRLKDKKHGDAAEIFIPVSSPQDAKKIYEANSPQAARTLRKRLDLVKSKGVVNELEMPDTKMEILTKMNQMSMERMKTR